MRCRVALVVGNCAYADSPLQNPINDANAVLANSAIRLYRRLQTDASREAMPKAITAFCVQLAKQSGEPLLLCRAWPPAGLENYLVPVDARLVSAADVARIITVDLSSLRRPFAGR